MKFGYGGVPLLRGVNLSVPAGAFVTLLGPSGCGKTTLLKLIAGYLTPTAGAIRLHGREVTGEPPQRRNAGFVFQNYALFPHLSARCNVSFPLEVRGLSKAETASRVDAVLDRVRLPEEVRNRQPRMLSGGQQQRVALARALVFNPDVLLLDEPLANLDRQLRDEMRGELRRVQRETGVTTLFVTHDPDEAFAVSDFLGVMLDGSLRQLGPPDEVYHRPVSEAVARSLGEANILPGELLGRAAGIRVLLRPEHLRPGDVFPGRVTAVRFHGADALAEVGCAGFTLLWRTRTRPLPAVGDAVSLGVDPADVWELP